MELPQKRLPLIVIGMFISVLLQGQILEVYRSYDHSPENRWTTWENIARPWLFAEHSTPFNHMTIVMTNVPHGGSYEEVFNTVRPGEPFQWIQDLPTGRYSWFARFEIWDGTRWRWTNEYQGPDFYVDRDGPNYMNVSANGYPVSYTTPFYWTSRSDLTFTWSNPGDPGSGVHHYEVSVDNGAYQTVQSGYTPNLTTGAHSYQFRAVDNIGLTGSGEKNCIRVDLDPPSCNPYDGYGIATGNPNPSWSRHATVRIMINASDIGSGIYDRYMAAGDGDFSPVFMEVAMTLDNGYHSFAFKARDRVGHESGVKRLYARIDRERPALTRTMPLNDTLTGSDSLELAWTGVDTVSGLHSFHYALDRETSVDLGRRTDTVIKNIPEGAHELILIAVDNALNRTYDTLCFYADHTPPVISSTLPDVQLAGDANCEAVLPDYTAELTVSDEYSAECTVAQEPVAGTVLNGTNHEVTLTAADEAGNISEVSFNVEITDQIDPVVSFTGEPEIQLDDACSAGLPDLTDHADLAVTECNSYTVTQEPVPGTSISDTTLVTLTAADESGNRGSCTVKVKTIDYISPVIECMEDQKVMMAEGESLYTVPGQDWDPASLTDNCDEVEWVNDLNQSASLSGAQLEEGATMITWTATDAYGNSSSCSFMVTVQAFVGMDEKGAGGVSVYPNPTGGLIHVSCSGGISRITVSDITGRIVKNVENCGVACQLDFSKQDQGIYFIRIRSGEKEYTDMVVLK